jgi:acyl-CoA thioester hydrolase
MGALTQISRRVRWADTDATGRLHFPRIFDIVQEAEAELLRSIAWPVGLRESKYDLPRVNVECSFHRMLMHDTPFLVRLRVGQLGRSSIRYEFDILDAENEVAIRGTMTVVVLLNGRPAEIPESLRLGLSGDSARGGQAP